MPRKAALTLTLLTVLLASCAVDKGGSRETRPIEVAFRVTRPSNAAFSVVALQADNADHRFDDSVLETPYLFVMENALQPVSGTFENLDPSLPITVELYFGTDLVKTEEIAPGTCCTVALDRGCAQATEICDDPPVINTGKEVKFELVSIRGSVNVGFSATLGDENATNITACAAASDVCRTPAVFFLENASGFVSGVFNKLSDQDPSAYLEVELYVNGDLKDSAKDKNQVVVSHDL